MAKAIFVSCPTGELTLARFRKVELITQTEAAECGLACLAMISNSWGHRLDLNTLRQEFSISLKGATLADLLHIADRLSLDARALRLDVGSLNEIKLPCILHWNLDHFVVLTNVGRSNAKIYDPSLGILTISKSELSRRFSGVALEITPRENLTPLIHSDRMSLWHLIGGASGLKVFFIQVTAISLVSQGLFLVTPFYIQMIIDEVTYGNLNSFPFLLIFGFILLQLLIACADAVRARLGIAMGQLLGYQLATRLMRHLLRLPVPYFERRFTGDIFSRLQSVRPIQEEITRSFAEIFSELIITLASIAVLLYYSLAIGVSVAAVFGAYVATVLFSLNYRLRLKHEFSTRVAEEQSHVLETIRGSGSIKVYGKEHERLAFWQSRLVKAQNVDANLEVSTADIRSVRTFFDAVGLLLVAYFGALAISINELTYGGLIAVFIFRGLVFSKGTSLIDRVSSFRFLQVHVDRLRDIAQAKTEPQPVINARSPKALKGIIFQDVSFQYGSSEREILAGINLNIRPDEYIAIVGQSGSGKSTFLKVVLGLYMPTKGAILSGDGNFAVNDPVTWRSMFGVVQQDDQLLAGTIIENISFYDIQVDFDRVVSSAREAQIHDAVLSFPMGYQSIIGDMGSLMSEGQKQRLLLARALYKNPSVLLLDEGTSDLDLVTERLVADVVQNLKMTRIVVAHRPELVRRADRIFELRMGSLIEIDRNVFDAAL